MIAHLRGELLSKSPNQVVLECAGVGYDIAISVESFSALPEHGAEARLHIHTHVREDQIALFGFVEPRERRLFEKLLTISGVGPRLALTVLSGIATDRLIAAIRAQDHASLTRIPGIGKKTAERLVLELKDKLDDLAVTTPAAPGHVSPAARLSPVAEDAISALVNLGYPRAAAERAVATALENSPTTPPDQAPDHAGGFEALFRAAMTTIR